MTLSPRMCSVHTHSTLCDGKASPEAMAAAAYDAGVKVCTSYGIPVGYNTPEVQEKRGGNAAQVYAVMLGES